MIRVRQSDWSSQSHAAAEPSAVRAFPRLTILVCLAAGMLFNGAG
jgi:hypothetical protein